MQPGKNRAVASEEAPGIEPVNAVHFEGNMITGMVVGGQGVGFKRPISIGEDARVAAE